MTLEEHFGPNARVKIYSESISPYSLKLEMRGFMRDMPKRYRNMPDTGTNWIYDHELMEVQIYERAD